MYQAKFLFLYLSCFFTCFSRSYQEKKAVFFCSSSAKTNALDISCNTYATHVAMGKLCVQGRRRCAIDKRDESKILCDRVRK